MPACMRACERVSKRERESKCVCVCVGVGVCVCGVVWHGVE